MAAAGLIAAGAVGAATLVRLGDDPPPRVAARATPGRTADDALLDAIEQRFAARRPRTPPPAAQQEYRDWIAGRFGSARDGLLLP